MNEERTATSTMERPELSNQADKLPSGSLPSDGRFARRVLVGLICLISADVLILMADGSPPARVATVAALLWVPGNLLLRAFHCRPFAPVAEAVVTVAASLTVVMVSALATNVFGQWLGIARPLDRGPLLVTLNLALLVLIVTGLRRSTLDLPQIAWRHMTPAALLLLPILSGLGALRLNTGRSNALALLAVAAVGLALAYGAVAGPRLGDRRLGLLLFSAAAALTLAYSMRTGYLYGYDIQQEFGTFAQVHAAGVWHPASSGRADDALRAMLSITLLPQVFVAVLGLPAIAVFKVVIPLLIGGIPAAVYALARRRVACRAAFAAAAVPLLLPQLSGHLPAIARQAVALLLFVALLIVLFETDLEPAGRRAAAVVLSTGMVLSHYTTSYLALITLGGTWLLVTILRWRVGWRFRRAVSGGLVIWLLTFCVAWNVVFTKSVTNVEDFATGTLNHGVQFLPANGGDASLVERWLKSPTPAVHSGDAYGQEITAAYSAKYPWMDHYQATGKVSINAQPVQPETGLIPALRPLITLIVLMVNQFLLIAFVVSVCLFCWTTRKRNDSVFELATAGAVVLGMTGFARISGTVMASYNADRLYLQSTLILSVALAATLSEVGSRRHWISATRTAGAWMTTVVLFLGTTQLFGLIGGGDLAPSVTNSGEAAERYLYTSEDVASISWIDEVVPPGALIFADRYAMLPIWMSASKHSDGIYTTIAPSAVDPRGFIFLTTNNVVHSRARGFVGRSISVYQPSRSFFDLRKNLIFSTTHTEIYR